MNRLAAVVIPLLLLVVALPTASRADEATLAAGREHTSRFQNGDLDALWDAMTGEMRQALGSREAFSRLREAVEGGFGREEAVLSETAERQSGYRIYLRVARHAGNLAPLLTQWTYDSDDAIAGFFVRPAQQPAQSRFLDYETRAALRLPFEDTWTVFWGGRTPEQNYHAVDRGQRFALDLLIVRDGSTHAGEGRALEDYHCWNRPILAPAAGTVAAVVDGLPDQAIGETDPAHPAGNHVVLDLGNDEFAFLAHLRRDSVAVKAGDRVESGQEIGRCGNSGNTSEPHLHFHLQTAPALGEGEGLPAFFNAYLADGEPVARGEPLRGQTVAPQAGR